MSPAPARRGALALVLASTLVAAPATAVAAPGPKAPKPPKPPKPPKADFTLTILHADDLESSLLPATGTDGSTYGGVDRFVELLQREQRAAVTGARGPGQAGERGLLTVSAGDNSLPGPQLAASEGSGRPVHDATAFSAPGFDVSIFGDHDFDQNPDPLAEWLGDVSSGTAFVPGNLGFDAEPRLLAVDEATSRPVPVLAQGPDAVRPDAQVHQQVVQPVQQYVSSLAQRVLARAEVPLNGVRNDVRSRETNLGDMATDALLAAGAAGAAGVPVSGR